MRWALGGAGSSSRARAASQGAGAGEQRPSASQPAPSSPLHHPLVLRLRFLVPPPSPGAPVFVGSPPFRRSSRGAVFYLSPRPAPPCVARIFPLLERCCLFSVRVCARAFLLCSRAAVGGFGRFALCGPQPGSGPRSFKFSLVDGIVLCETLSWRRGRSASREAASAGSF